MSIRLDPARAAWVMPLIQAVSEGRTVQRKMGTAGWIDVGTFDFEGKPENYRIKPEPDTCWGVRPIGQTHAMMHFGSRIEADRWLMQLAAGREALEVVEYREVTR